MEVYEPWRRNMDDGREISAQIFYSVFVSGAALLEEVLKTFSKSQEGKSQDVTAGNDFLRQFGDPEEAVEEPGAGRQKGRIWLCNLGGFERFVSDSGALSRRWAPPGREGPG